MGQITRKNKLIGLSIIFIYFLLAGSLKLDAEGIPEYFSEPENLGEFVTNAGTLDSAYGVEDGKEVLYTTVTGNPALFYVIDLHTNEKLQEIPLEGGGMTWGHVVDANGLVYIASGKHLFVYDPTTKEVTNLGNPTGSTTLFGLVVDENNVVYGGTYPTGQVFKYDPEVGEIELYEAFHSSRQYVQDVAYYNGIVYAGTASNGGLYRLNPDDGSREYIPFPEETGYTESEAPGIFRMMSVNELLFIHMSSDPNVGLIYDMKNGEWVEVIQNYRSMYVTPELDGKVYYIANNHFVAFDLATKVSTPTNVEYSLYFRHGKWIEVEGDPELPNKTLATIASGSVKLINLETGVIKDRVPVVKGTPISVQAMEFGPDGLLYMGGYHGSSGTRYNIETGETEVFSIGQTEGMTPYQDKMMFGVYAGAQIYALDTTQPISDNNPTKVHDIEDEQDRPFAMTSGDGYLFAGTISKLGTYGGAISIFDGKNWETHRNVVEDQSIMGLAYVDGKLYGSTTIWNGLGIEPTQTAAKIFVWDVESGEKITEFIPDITLADGQKAKAIGSLSVGPDGNIWGAAYGTIFAMDPNTYEIVKQKEIVSTDWNFSHAWSPVKLRWDGTTLYTTLGSQIVVIDTETMEHQAFPGTKTNLMVLGSDGNIYYSEASMLKRIKVIDDVNAPVQTYLTVKNADFEMDTVDGNIPGWQPMIQQEHTSISISEDVANSGSQSLHIVDATTTGYAMLESDLIEVVPNQEYKVGVNYYLADPPVNPAGGHFSSNRSILQVRYYDENEQLISYSTGLGVGLEGQLGRWHSGELAITPIENAKYMRIQLGGSIKWVSNVYYDDLYVSTNQAPEVLEVNAIPSLTVSYGTKIEDIPLPNSVGVKLSNNNQMDLMVNWKLENSDYNSELPGTYNFVGTLQMPEGVQNSNALEASIEIIVTEKAFGQFKNYYSIKNADFEEAIVDGVIPGWNILNQNEHTELIVSEEQSKSGVYSLNLRDASTTGYAVLESEMISVESSKKYVAGANYYLGEPLINPETGTPFSSSRTLFQVRFYDENKQFINVTRGLGIIFDGKLGEWRTGEFAVTPPESAAYMVLHLASNNAYVSNAFYDDVFVYSLENTEVVEVETLSPLQVKYGTDVKNLDLPQEVEIVLNDESYRLTVPVDWSEALSQFDGMVAGTYTLNGSMQLPEGINNREALLPSIKVQVLEQEQPPVEEPGDDTGETPGEEPGDDAEETPGEEPGDDTGETPGEEPGDDIGETPGEELGDDAEETPGENTQQDQDNVIIVPESEADTIELSTNQLNRVKMNGTITIDLTDFNTKKVNVVLSQEQVSMLKNRNVSILILKSDMNVTIPVSNMNGTENVTIAIEKYPDQEGTVSSVYNLTIKQGDKILDTFKEAVKIAFQLDISKINNKDTVQLYYYDEENEKWLSIGGEVSDTIITANTDHFTIFAAMEEKEEESINSEEVEKENHSLPNTATNTYTLFLIGSMLLVIGYISFLAVRRKM